MGEIKMNIDINANNDKELMVVNRKNKKSIKKSICYENVKRVIDFFTAIFFLTILFIPMIIVAICIKLEDGRANSI